MSNIKKEVEELLKCAISDEQYHEALEMAKKKQKYIYEQDNRKCVMEDWYLAILTKEYVVNLAFSRFTMDLCRALNGSNMEKERSAQSTNTPTTNHIVPVFAE